MKVCMGYKIASLFCFGFSVYYAIVDNIQMATHIFLCGFYADWLAEKEK